MLHSCKVRKLENCKPQLSNKREAYGMLRFITPGKGRMRNVLVKPWQWIGTVGLIWLQQHKEQLSRGDKRARELPAHGCRIKRDP